MKVLKLFLTFITLLLLTNGCIEEECSNAFYTLEINFGPEDCNCATIVYNPCKRQNFEKLYNLEVRGTIRGYALNDWGGGGSTVTNFKEAILIEPDNTLNHTSEYFEQEIDFSEFSRITDLVIYGNVGSIDGKVMSRSYKRSN